MAGQGGWGQGWGQNWLKQVQETTQIIARQAGEGVSEARRRLEENQPQMEQFMKQLGDNVQKSVQNIQKGLAGASLDYPPTQDELSRLDFVYLTDRLVAMAFPVDRHAPRTGLNAERNMQGNDLDVVASLLKHRHGGHYMIWNASEETYDYSKFEDQVLEYCFPGHPAPPLGMLFKMCTSLENWLDADPENIAVVHCLTGKGRTAAIAACFLAWSGEFSTPTEALQHVAERKRAEMERLTIPSQRRYIGYFSNMLDGVRPRSEPLLLRRVIMNTIPTFGRTDGAVLRADQPPPPPEEGGPAVGCCPYLQVFKNGKLVFTTTYQPAQSPRDRRSHSGGAAAAENVPADAEAAATAAAAAGSEAAAMATGSLSPAGKTKPLQRPWAYPSDESIVFGVDCAVQGDLLIRCRHLSPGGERVSMFRAAFHTGYVPCGVLRLSKSQLDGACDDARFDQDFFLDLIFAPVELSESDGAAAGKEGASEAAKEVKAPAEAPEKPPEMLVSPEDAENEAAAVQRGLVLDAEAAEAYDSMLHRDARFWEEMSERKERRQQREAARAAAAAAAASATAASPQQRSAAGALGLMAPAKERAQRKQFSIFGADGGDAGGDEEEASTAQKAALRKAGGGSGGGGGEATSAKAGVQAASAVAAKPPARLISDHDLLAQLAEAEQDGFVTVGPPSPLPAPKGSPAAAQTSASSAAAASAAGAATGLTPAETGSASAAPALSTVSTSGGASAAAPTAASSVRASPAPPGASKELSDLEQLERELGIEDLTGMRGGGSGGGGGGGGGDHAGDVTDFDLDANLDELEGYLESLSKK